MAKTMIIVNNTTVKPQNTAKNGNARKRTPKRTARRRFAIDIGKAISLALMAAKYDWDPRIDGNGGAE